MKKIKIPSRIVNETLPRISPEEQEHSCTSPKVLQKILQRPLRNLLANFIKNSSNIFCMQFLQGFMQTFSKTFFIKYLHRFLYESLQKFLKLFLGDISRVFFMYSHRIVSRENFRYCIRNYCPETHPENSQEFLLGTPRNFLRDSFRQSSCYTFRHHFSIFFLSRPLPIFFGQYL